MDQVHHALTRLRSRVDRGRRHAVQHRAGRRRDVDRPEEAGVRRDLGPDERLDRVVHGREESGPHEVQSGAHLRRALEMQEDLVASDLDAGPEDLLLRHFVGFEPVLELVDPRGDRRDAGAGQSLGVVQQRVARREHELRAVFRAQRAEALDALAVRGHLRTEVVESLARHLAVQQDQLEHVLLDPSLAIEPHRRNPEPFLVDMRVPAVDEVRMVRDVRGPRRDRPVDEDRLHHHDVGKVCPAARVRVVADEDVALAHLLERMARRHVLHHAHQRAEMHRDVHRLAERAAARVEETRRAVAPLLHVRRVRGAHERLAHLLDDRRQRVADDLDQNWISEGGFALLPTVVARLRRTPSCLPPAAGCAGGAGARRLGISGHFRQPGW